MAKIDLLQLYPHFKSGMHEIETCFIEIPDAIEEEYMDSLTPEIAYVHIFYERQEVAYIRKMFRHKAIYSLNSELEGDYKADQLQNALSICVPSAEEVYLENIAQNNLVKSINALPKIQRRRIYEYFFLERTLKK